MSKYRAYPEYKDSGVEWLGDVPADWHVTKIGFLSYKTGSGKTPKGGGEVYLSSGVLFLRSQNVYDSGLKIDEDDLVFISEDVDAEMSGSRVQCGDILLNITGASIGRTCIVPKNFQKANVNQHVCIIRVPITLQGFVALYLKSVLIKAQIDSAQSGAAREGLNFEQLSNIRISVPRSEAERECIANFLDHETAKIDTLIEKQQQLIQLLKEKRQAVISHAVTKGLNPNAKMKDSGVEWLGDVPEHWEIRTVSRVSSKITNGYVGPTRDILVEDGVSYVQATHIKNGKVNFDGAYFVRETWSEAHSKSILSRGDVLIVQTGAGTGDIGLISESEEGFNCHALIIVQPVKDVISGQYLSMALQSQYGYSKLYSIRTGGMHPHLNCGEVQYVKLPVPPRSEQDEITSHIDEQVKKFDLLINRQLDAISLMQERRTALISAAVTGKIDVRNWVAPVDSRLRGNDGRGGNDGSKEVAA